MSLQQIPLDNSPNQSFTITVTVDNENITLNNRLCYNSQCSRWMMSVAQKGATLLGSIPLVTGPNLLAAHSYLGIGSAYVVNVGASTLDSPDDTTLGTDFILLWGNTDEQLY